MAHELICPSCGEDEELRGEPRQGDIRISCGSCGAVWMRGAPVCATCGGRDIVERPQAMTRYSRGTQLSVVGWRQLPLCRGCDADALGLSIGENVPVPAEYVSAALHAREAGPHAPGAHRSGPPSGPGAPSPADSPSGSASTGDRDDAGAPGRSRNPTAASGSGSSSGSGSASQRAPSTARHPAPKRAGPKPAGSGAPTVRQAIATFLAETSGDVDHTAMLLLGTHLGSYRRLTDLDGESAAESLAAWFAGRWEDRDSPAGRRARETICRAVDFWGARGWLTSDPAAALR